MRAKEFFITNNESGPHEAHQQKITQKNDGSVEADILTQECELVRAAYAILQRRSRRYDEFNSGIFGKPPGKCS